jgi:hypothetical protein
MSGNGSRPHAPPRGSGVRLRSYCAHDEAREIRIYSSYAEANAVRLRLTLAPDHATRHVSMIYEIPGGWAWTVCDRCAVNESRTATAGE